MIRWCHSDIGSFNTRISCFTLDHFASPLESCAVRNIITRSTRRKREREPLVRRQSDVIQVRVRREQLRTNKESIKHQTAKRQKLHTNRSHTRCFYHTNNNKNYLFYLHSWCSRFRSVRPPVALRWRLTAHVWFYLLSLSEITLDSNRLLSSKQIAPQTPVLTVILW